MKNVGVIFLLLSLVSCGKKDKDSSSANTSGNFAINSLPVRMDFLDIEPGLACANGGIAIFSFYDTNFDGIFEEGEALIKSKSICNGTNGTNASITVESVATSMTCINGGVKISSTTSTPVEICNGINGLNGEQGIPGIQGIPGMVGATGAAGINGINGTIVTPIKFCENDNSAYPEYGLIIGDEVYAVYWGVTPASPTNSQAFLAKLSAGNYMSSGGNNCIFSIP